MQIVSGKIKSCLLFYKMGLKLWEYLMVQFFLVEMRAFMNDLNILMVPITIDEIIILQLYSCYFTGKDYKYVTFQYARLT